MRQSPLGMAVAKPAGRPWSVTDTVRRIQLALAEGLPPRFALEGEISGYKLWRTGHAYFALKDETSQIEAVIWAQDMARIRFTPGDGMAVLAQVRKVDFYGPHGRLRLHVDGLEPVGLGALARALEQLKERLRAEGLFDESRKRPLPPLPATVGIATAEGGAAIQDMLKILRSRFRERRILLRPCKVQGDGAAEDIAAAIDDLNREGSAEVLIIGRGGGSAEDLWAFNMESVARAIARSRIPVVSAVGHESDWTVADLVADVRAPTPTAAAQLVMPEREVLLAAVRQSSERLEYALTRQVSLARERLGRHDKALADPRRLVVAPRLHLEKLSLRVREALRQLPSERRLRLQRAAGVLAASIPNTAAVRQGLWARGDRLEAGLRRQLGQLEAELAKRAGSLDALSPLQVLTRGYALVRRPDGSVIEDASALAPGDSLDLRFARGGARAEVMEIWPETATQDEE